MRISRAGLALVKRVNFQGKTEYLTLWNHRWQAYSLIGGHVEPGESFRQCCIREVVEELNIRHDIDFQVASQPIDPHCEYTAMSESAGVPTQYDFEVFPTEIITAEGLAKVDAQQHNRWVDEEEIRQHRTADGRPISVQVETVLNHYRLRE